jgi:hypothetical protein
MICYKIVPLQEGGKVINITVGTVTSGEGRGLKAVSKRVT